MALELVRCSRVKQTNRKKKIKPKKKGGGGGKGREHLSCP